MEKLIDYPLSRLEMKSLTFPMRASILIEKMLPPWLLPALLPYARQDSLLTLHGFCIQDTGLTVYSPKAHPPSQDNVYLSSDDGTDIIYLLA